MLALATTTVTVQGAATGGTDAHGAPKRGVGPLPAPRGPYGAARDNGTPILLDDGREVRGVTFHLDPDAWPVQQGDVITDAEDNTRWTVEGAAKQGAALGLDQVTAKCTAVRPQVT